MFLKQINHLREHITCIQQIDAVPAVYQAPLGGGGTTLARHVVLTLTLFSLGEEHTRN